MSRQIVSPGREAAYNMWNASKPDNEIQNSLNEGHSQEACKCARQIFARADSEPIGYLTAIFKSVISMK